MISQPTRNENILDLIFTNITDNPFDCTISKYKKLSDHNLIQLKLNHSEPSIPENTTEHSTKRTGYKKYNFYKADYDAINSDLSKIDWNSEMDAKPVSEQLEKFNDIVLKIISHHTSEIQNTRKRHKSKFYRERRTLWRRRSKINKKNPENSEKLLEDIELSIKKSHIAERLHNEHLAIEKISSNSKYFYTYANTTRKNKGKVGPLINKDTDEVISNPTEIAESLQTQYCSVFTTPDSTKLIENTQEFFNDTESSENPVHSILSDIKFSEEDIVTAIKKIKPNAAAGPDGIPTILLRECCQELSKPLHIIYRNSLDSGEVPSVLKDAIVTPIHKGGLKSDVKNYRPVSLISQLLKILEKRLCLT